MRKFASAKPNRKTVVDRLFLLQTLDVIRLNFPQVKFSHPSKLSEYSECIQYAVHSMQYTVRTPRRRVKFYRSQGAALGAAFGRAGAASRSCEGAASIREPRSCVFEGAARRKFDKKFQIFKNFS